MISRTRYLEQGLPPLEFASCVSSQIMEDMDEENEQSSVMCGTKRPLGLRRTNIPSQLDTNRRKLAEIEKRAAAVQPGVAPSIYLSDMPSYFPLNLRNAIYVRLLALGIDFERVSRRAIAHEMTPPELYWDKAVNDCIPLIEAAILRSQTRKGSLPPKGISALNDAFEVLEDQLADQPAQLGKSEVCTSLLSIFLTDETNLSSQDLEILLSHFLVHSRIGNRHLRLLKKLAGCLPSQDPRHIEMIQNQGLATEAYGLAQSLSAKAPKEFLKQGAEHLRNVADALRGEAQSKSTRAVSKAVVDFSTDDSPDLFAVMRHGEINRYICENLPAGQFDLQMRAFAFQIAALRITERRASGDNLICFPQQDA